jgi:hypothetical protein
VRGAILGTKAEVDTDACPTASTPPGTRAPDSTTAAGHEACGGCTVAEVRSVGADVWAGTEDPSY